ncbi:MAG: hypothetical protein WC824_10655 [Bacteroidota bacterium]|jgi:hypothetical protein
MKYRNLSILFLAAAFSFGGCIETQMLVTIMKDGSGTIRQTVKMKKKVTAPLREMSIQMQQSMAENDSAGAQEQKPFELFSETEIRGNAEKLGTNVRYVSHALIDDEESDGYVGMYAFDDLNSVKVNQNPTASMPESAGGEGTIDADDELILFSFTRGNPSKLVIRPPKMKESESVTVIKTEGAEIHYEGQGTDSLAADGQQGEGALGEEQMKEFFRDMHIVVQIAVDGEISETNASYVDGSTITLMDVNFNTFLDDPALEKQLKEIEAKGPAAAKEMFKNIPGLRVETEEEITVLFD